MTIGKLFIFIQFLIRHRLILILSSLFSLAVIDLVIMNFDSPVVDVVPLLVLLPYLLLVFYAGLFVFRLHHEGKKWLIIAVFACTFFFGLTLQADNTNLLLRLIQTLLSVSVIVGWLYLFVQLGTPRTDEGFRTNTQN